MIHVIFPKGYKRWSRPLNSFLYHLGYQKATEETEMDVEIRVFGSQRILVGYGKENGGWLLNSCVGRTASEQRLFEDLYYGNPEPKKLEMEMPVYKKAVLEDYERHLRHVDHARAPLKQENRNFTSRSRQAPRKDYTKHRK